MFRRFHFNLAVPILFLASLVASGSASPPFAQQQLRWKSNKIRLAVSGSVTALNPNIKYGSDVLGAVRRSFEAWKNVVDLEFVVEASKKENVSGAGRAGDGVSLITIAATPENVRLFGGSDSSLAAKTRVFFDTKGQITEADIVLNPYQQFSVDGTYGTFDLETTLRHEIGHLLGLRHSNVIGSVMYHNSPRNGVYGSFESSAAGIAYDDVAAIRDLYPSVDESKCCASLNGRITGFPRAAGSFEFWAEDVSSGLVSAHSYSSRDGQFRFGGLSDGNYRIFGRFLSKSGYWSILDLGEAALSANETSQISRKAARQSRDFSLSVLGINGILGDATVPLKVGGISTVYVGGIGISADTINFRFNSPYISVVPDSTESVDYGEGITVLRFQVNVNPEAPLGIYSVFGVKEDGSVDSLVGGITLTDNKRN